MDRDALLRVLAAPGPRAEHSDRLDDFGQLVGSWDLDMTALESWGDQRRFAGEWHFGWVLDGRSVQDVLITRSESGDVVGYGSTVRSFDARRGVWWVVWQDPLAGEFAVLLGGRESDSLVLEGQWTLANRQPFRWTFSGITSDSFEWTSEVADDGGAWQLRERFVARRRRT
jgi:hypothetical protein